MESEKDYQKGRTMALDFLSRKARTVFEVKRKLCQKGICEGALKEIIFDLKEEKLLDDKRYVLDWLDLVAARKGYGKLLVFKKLQDLGVERELILAGYQEGYEEKEKKIASREAISKLKSFRSDLLERKKKAKLAYFLKSRGFQEELIFRILDELFDY